MKVKEFTERDAFFEEKEELLTLWLEEEGFNIPLAPIITPREKAERPPLSFAQQRLWFLNRLESGSSAYNVPTAICLTGLLNVAALEQSLNEIVHRHEALRTTFVMVDGQPAQVIAPVLRITLPVVDLQHVPETEREAEVQQLATKEARRPFDLAQGPLLRAILLRLTETEHVFLLTMHHIVTDGWSMGVFFRELAVLYEAFAAGRPSPLSRLLVQYADFAVWQRQWLQGEVLETQLAYWQQQLACAPPVLELPTDHPRSPIQTFRGASQSFILSATLTEALKALSQRNGVTLFMTLLAAFKVLLYRYTGQTDILVGTPVANRNRSEIEGLMGFFVNTLVLRTDLSGNPTFQELLQRVSETALGAYAHQDIPFERLVEALRPERNLSRQPLFQVMFILQNAPMEPLELPGLNSSLLEVDTGTARFDLTLSMGENEQGLIGSLVYNTDLFDVATISRMAGHFQTLLAGIVTNLQQRLSELPLLTDAERQQLLVQWNDTKTDYPKDQCIHELFEAQAERTPNAVAVVFENEQLTYRELNRRANQVAHHLHTLGVGPEVCVGICMERSLEMVVGLLGIVKAGAAYVPFDPAFPKERLTSVLEEVQTSVLLTQQRLVKNLPKHQVHLICMDTGWEAIAQESEENPVSEATTENLVYVIFTSGSTGRPKGVAVEHRQLINYLNSILERLDLSAGVNFALVSAFTADLGNTAIFPALCTGGCLHVVSQERASNPDALSDYFRRHPIDCLKIVPSHLAALLASSDHPEQILPRRRLVLGGEASSWDLIEKLRMLGLDCLILNHYGPTETTVGVITYLVEQGQPMEQVKGNRSATLPLGRPIANTQVYLLDCHLRPVPIGVPGELYIGGDGLSRGYLNQPELTAEKFIPNPFSNKLGARLYRTGDLARYLPDGNIEFLGRIDHQVKLRGFRIELEEIETLLAQHPAVRETLVIVREDSPGDKRLVGYVVPHQEQVLTSSELRSFLKKMLPDYMVPSAFMLLKALPLTPNGKIDLRALPAPDTSRAELAATCTAPRDLLELRLVQIWENLLDVHPIGVTDNFFDLGGHSLLAVRLMAQIQQQFGQDLPVATLFQGATVEHLASVLRLQSPISNFQPPTPLAGIQSCGSKQPFFCVHPIGGNVLCYVALARLMGSDQPFYGLQALGLDGEQEPCTRIEDMAAHYIEALRIVQPEGPYFLGGWSMGGVVAFEMAQQLQKQGHRVAVLALFDSRAPVSGSTLTGTGKLTENEDDAKLLAEFLRDMTGTFAKDLPVSYNSLKQLRPDEQLNYVLEQARMLALVPSDAGPLQIRRLLQVFKANIRAVSSYVPQVYPGRMILFRASEGGTEGGALGWSELSVQPVQIYSVPGNHYTMLSMPSVQVLARRLRVCLEEAQVAN
jgi:amino acid adenylation domain-containing protein